jgi:hypothetical protein
MPYAPSGSNRNIPTNQPTNQPTNLTPQIFVYLYNKAAMLISEDIAAVAFKAISFRPEAIKAVNIKTAVFWDVMPWSLVDMSRRSVLSPS